MLRRALAAALVSLTPLAAQWAGLLSPIDDRLAALRMAALPRAPTGNVVLIDIDARSIDAIAGWPWPRRVYGELIDGLVALGASEIGIDVDFSAKSNPDDDAALEEALARAGGVVVLAAFAQRASGSGEGNTVYRSPLERFAGNAWIASVTVAPDRDGSVRRFPYGLVVNGEVVPSMPTLLGGGYGDASEAFLIDFSINAGLIDHIAVIDVLRRDVDPARIAGKKVIVGAQAAELRDFFNVPVAGVVSGTVLQAVATETLLQGRELREMSTAAGLGGLILIAFAGFAMGRVRWSIVMAALASTMIGLELAAAVLQGSAAVVVATAQWQLALLVLAATVLVSELGLREIVQRMWRLRAKNAEAILGRVVADSFTGVAVIDEAGRIRAASRAAAKILGSQSDLVGALAADVLPAVLASKVTQVIGQLPGEGTEWAGGEVVFRRDGDERLLEFVVTLSEGVGDPGSNRQDSGAARVACLTFSDVTARRAGEARINHMARFDALTDLPNRNQLIEFLEATLATGDRAARAPAIVGFDLDGFKNVNDTLGHGVGDLLLCAVARRASQLIPAGGMVARIGGDEFAAVVSGEDADRLALQFATQLVARLGQPFEIGVHRIVVSCSAGVALGVKGSDGPDDALKRADMALYRAKAASGNGFAVFEPDMLAAVAARQRIELDLWLALEREEFEVWYQPQVDLRDGSLIGVEALLRWRHPERGMVMPGEFIFVAEAIGLIEALGRWVLVTACTEAATWPVPIKLSVNVSSAQFARSDVVAIVSDALERSSLDPTRLDLEITESLFLQPTERVLSALARLRAMDVGLSLDDFGTGYSSLSYLNRFPLTKIKLDRTFVSALPANAGSAAIVRAVAALARELDVRLNAEGVETLEQDAFLRLVGVDEGQGYLYGRPQPAADIVRLLAVQGEPLRLRALA